MKVDLSDEDLDVLDKALVAYEQQGASTGLLGAIASAMVPDAHRAEFEAKRRIEDEKAEREQRARRIQSSMIRTKLFQAQASDAINKAAAPGATV